jgi:hypothetical protein
MPQFSLKMVIWDYPYDMPTTMMEGLQKNVSTYTTTTFSPYNTHLVSGSVISNPARMIQPSLNQHLSFH